MMPWRENKIDDLADLKENALYTANELAPLLKVTKRTLRRYCEEKVFAHATKLGCQWRIPGCDVLAIFPHLTSNREAC
ncbi:MAG: helix-turn-helix domain-containing protein [Deltaproteobacteria bacterium]|nr:helix-turn-helix domain-containing protein [Deltaproteobacteria bacterium]